MCLPYNTTLLVYNNKNQPEQQEHIQEKLRLFNNKKFTFIKIIFQPTAVAVF